MKKEKETHKSLESCLRGHGEDDMVIWWQVRHAVQALRLLSSLCWTRPRGTGWGCVRSPSLVSGEDMRLRGKRSLCSWGEKTSMAYAVERWSENVLPQMEGKTKNKKTRSSKPCQIQLGLVWSSYVSAEAAIYSFLFFFFNWRIFGLQCCIGFWYTTTQTNCKYIYLFIPSSWDPYPSHSFRLSQSNQLNWSGWTYSLLYRVK